LSDLAERKSLTHSRRQNRSSEWSPTSPSLLPKNRDLESRKAGTTLPVRSTSLVFSRKLSSATDRVPGNGIHNSGARVPESGKLLPRACDTMAFRILAFVLLLGLDTFAVAMALGFRGFPPWRPALLFGVFEADMPRFGITLARLLGVRFETLAVVIGFRADRLGHRRGSRNQTGRKRSPRCVFRVLEVVARCRSRDFHG
jgi:hypothetical protein